MTQLDLNTLDSAVHRLMRAQEDDERFVGSKDRNRVRIGHQWGVSFDALGIDPRGDPWDDPVTLAVVGIDEPPPLTVDFSKRRWRWAIPRPAQPAAYSQREKCPAGHDYDDENTLWVTSPRNPEKKWRQCKKCRKARKAMTRSREKNTLYQRERRRARNGD